MQTNSLDFADREGEGIKQYEIFADVIYGWSLIAWVSAVLTSALERLLRMMLTRRARRAGKGKVALDRTPG